MDQNTPTNTGTTGAGATGDYNIPQVVQDKYPDLVQLILATESMSKEEREYWFQILPIMTDEQVSRLRVILEEEATQLRKLDDQYQDDLQKLNQKHLEEWNQFERDKERKVLKAEEAQAEQAEAATEAELLQKIQSADGN
ncbi:hypothetical protein KKC94_00310 [Patescibacteria group bacterium]|nr:hypothetical protein [Patescibacteria group bacterium]